MALLQRAATASLGLAVVAAALIAAHFFYLRSSPRLQRQLVSRILPPSSLSKECRAPTEAPQESMSVAASAGPVDDDYPAVVQAGGDKAIQPPSLLPERSDAVPLESIAPFLDAQVKTIIAPEADQELAGLKPAPQNHKPRDSAARRLIEKELGDSSVEDREVWHETLKDLAPNDLRELLRLRQQLGRLPRFVPQPFDPPQPGSPVPDARPLAGDARGILDSTMPSPELAERMIEQSRRALDQARQTILRNIANLQSVGYKRQIVLFENLSDNPPTKLSELASAKVGVACPESTRGVMSQIDTSPGKLRSTGRPLDVAVDGPGFLMVQNPKSPGERCYTRCGRLMTDSAARLVVRTIYGDLPLRPTITIPTSATAIEIDSTAQVYVRGADNARTTVGQLQTAIFPPGSALEPIGSVLYRAPEKAPMQYGAPGTSGHGPLRQGFLEESNVDVENELHELESLRKQELALDHAAARLSVAVPPLRAARGQEPQAGGAPRLH